MQNRMRKCASLGLMKMQMKYARPIQTATDANLQEKVINMCRHRGFVYPGSDIYGGLANSFDYGPLGVQMKKNIQDAWWKHFVQSRTDCVGLDSSVILSSKGMIVSAHLKEKCKAG